MVEKNPSDNSGKIPLHYAAKNGHLDICKLIYENINNKSQSDNFGQTPLHYAAENGHLDICKLIYENIDNKNPRDNSNKTPIDLAASKKRWPVVRFLIVENNLHSSPSQSKLSYCKNMLINLLMIIWECFHIFDG